MVAAGTGGYIGSLYSPDHKHYEAVGHEGSASSSYEGISESLPEAAGVPGPVERAIANPAPYSGQDHEKRDLAAQEGMAVWAFWMAFFAGITAIVTSIGTMFLAWQVKLTREAVEDTGRATKAMVRQNNLVEREQRPWIAIETGKPKFQRYMGTGLQILVPVTFRNIGKTVAVDLIPNVRTFVGGEDYSVEAQAWLDGLHQQKTEGGITLMPGEHYDNPPLKSLDTGKLSAAEMAEYPIVNIAVQAAAIYYSEGRQEFEDRYYTHRTFKLGAESDRWETAYFVTPEELAEFETVEFMLSLVGPFQTK